MKHLSIIIAGAAMLGLAAIAPASARGPHNCGGGFNPGRFPGDYTPAQCAAAEQRIETYLNVINGSWLYTTQTGLHTTPLGWTIYVNGRVVEQ